MRLELRDYPVDRVAFGSASGYAEGKLTLDAADLVNRLLADRFTRYFEDIRVDAVHPGDSTRILDVIDVVEPRVRLGESTSDFPGFIGSQQSVGAGATNRLSGMAVVEVAPPLPGESTYWREAIFDMAGPGARYSPFSSTCNLVLTFVPSREYSQAGLEKGESVWWGGEAVAEYNRAIRQCGLMAALYAAETTIGVSPSKVQTFELDGWSKASPQKNRPRIVYMYQLQSPYVYGEIAARGGVSPHPPSLPTLLHPNELLDGALINSYSSIAALREVTYLVQNHAVVMELYGSHGRTVDFAGAIVYTNGDSAASKERICNQAANLAAFLGADGAVLTTGGAGHPVVDVMLTCKKLEERGIKTTMLMPEMASQPSESGFVHFVREADAIVSVGNYEEVVALGEVDSVIGGTASLPTGARPTAAQEMDLRRILGSTSPLGHHALRGVEV